MEEVLKQFDERFYFLVDNNDKHKEVEVKQFLSQALTSQRTQIIERLTEIAYVPTLGSNQQWTGVPMKVVSLDQVIKEISK